MNMQPPLQRTANQLSDYGRFGDSTLVHMNPAEVSGLAAMSPTGELTINPVTGQPEAFLPFLAPIFGSLMGGAALGGTWLGTAGASALGSGLATWAATGDFEKGLISGVTGFGLGKVLQGAEAATLGSEIGAVDAAQQGVTEAMQGVAYSPELAQAGEYLQGVNPMANAETLAAGMAGPPVATPLGRAWVPGDPVGGMAPAPISAGQQAYLDASQNLSTAQGGLDTARAGITPTQRVGAMFSGEGLAGMGQQLKNPMAVLPAAIGTGTMAGVEQQEFMEDLRKGGLRDQAAKNRRFEGILHNAREVASRDRGSNPYQNPFKSAAGGIVGYNGGGGVPGSTDEGDPAAWSAEALGRFGSHPTKTTKLNPNTGEYFIETTAGSGAEQQSFLRGASGGGSENYFEQQAPPDYRHGFEKEFDFFTATEDPELDRSYDLFGGGASDYLAGMYGLNEEQLAAFYDSVEGLSPEDRTLASYDDILSQFSGVRGGISNVDAGIEETTTGDTIITEGDAEDTTELFTGDEAKAAADAAAKKAAAAKAAADRKAAAAAKAVADAKTAAEKKAAEEAQAKADAEAAAAAQAAADAAAAKAQADAAALTAAEAAAAEAERLALLEWEQRQHSCPSPETLIKLQDGDTTAGELKVGDLVHTQHEETLEWGDWPVTYVEIIENQPRLKLGFCDDSNEEQEIVCSWSHKFHVDGKEWVKAEDMKIGDVVNGRALHGVRWWSDGDVVKITVDEAHTYVAAGLLSHNKTPDWTDTNVLYDAAGNVYEDQPGWTNSTVASYLADGTLTDEEAAGIAGLLDSSSEEGKAAIMGTFGAFDDSFATQFQTYLDSLGDDTTDTTVVGDGADPLAAFGTDAATATEDELTSLISMINSGETTVDAIAARFGVPVAEIQGYLDSQIYDAAGNRYTDPGWTNTTVGSYLADGTLSDEEAADIAHLLDISSDEGKGAILGTFGGFDDALRTQFDAYLDSLDDDTTGTSTVVGGTGTDTVVGGTGTDTVVGGTGTATVIPQWEADLNAITAAGDVDGDYSEAEADAVWNLYMDGGATAQQIADYYNMGVDDFLAYVNQISAAKAGDTTIDTTTITDTSVGAGVVPAVTDDQVATIIGDTTAVSGADATATGAWDTMGTGYIGDDAGTLEGAYATAEYDNMMAQQQNIRDYVTNTYGEPPYTQEEATEFVADAKAGNVAAETVAAALATVQSLYSAGGGDAAVVADTTATTSADTTADTTVDTTVDTGAASADRSALIQNYVQDTLGDPPYTQEQAVEFARVAIDNNVSAQEVADALNIPLDVVTGFYGQAFASSDVADVAEVSDAEVADVIAQTTDVAQLPSGEGITGSYTGDAAGALEAGSATVDYQNQQATEQQIRDYVTSAYGEPPYTQQQAMDFVGDAIQAGLPPETVAAALGVPLETVQAFYAQGSAGGGRVGTRQFMTPAGRVYLQAGGIADIPAEAPMPEQVVEETFVEETVETDYPELVDMTIEAIKGNIENSDAVIEEFIAEYGAEAFQQLRDAVLKSVAGNPEAQTEGVISGAGAGMDDEVMGVIGEAQEIAVSPGEYIVAADVVSGLGDGSSDAGADVLDTMMQDVRNARTGGRQPKKINRSAVMPA